MDIEQIKNVIVTNRNRLQSVDLVLRDFNFDDKVNHVLVGVRQSGKSYLMFQHIKSLVANGVLLDHIVYINFDDERLFGFSVSDFDLILQAHFQLSSVKPLLFLDEIQNIKGWEMFARRLANEKYRVYITGSNAKMLSSEFATVLGGRYVMLNVYPYSFSEYLRANGFVFSDNWEYDTYCINHIRRLFNDYFINGGFPDVLYAQQKRPFLSSLFQKMLLGDVIARNRIKNVAALQFLTKKIAESIKQPLSYNRMKNMVSSLGEKVQTNTIIDYVRYLEDAYVIFSVRNMASQLVEKEGIKKYYYCDNGILNLFLMDGNTALLENLVSVELRRRYHNNFYFYNANVEVDFVAPEENLAIQVCYTLGDENSETYKRETKSLCALSKKMDYKKLMIITFAEERTLEINGKIIEVVPIWKWMIKK